MKYQVSIELCKLHIIIALTINSNFNLGGKS